MSKDSMDSDSAIAFQQDSEELIQQQDPDVDPVVDCTDELPELISEQELEFDQNYEQSYEQSYEEEVLQENQEEGIDMFPEDFNRRSCEMNLAENQYNLMGKTRAEFYQYYMEAQKNCDRQIRFEFPSRLWYIHRKTIALEILEKFDYVKITFCSETDVTKLFLHKVPEPVKKIDPDEEELLPPGPDKVPDQIKAVIIEFPERDISKKFAEYLATSGHMVEPFPDDFRRELWEKELTKNQDIFLKKIRGEFYAKFVQARDECEPSICLEFPKKLWNIHRKSITREILNKFMRIKVTSFDGHEKILLSTDNSISDNIRYITIEFVGS